MWNSSVGIKVVVAMTGAILLLFVIGHMVGNLQIYLGQEALNAYAEKLRAIPPLLYGIRLGLLLVAAIHVTLTLRLAVLNRNARPVPYARKTPVTATLSSRTMVVSGLTVLAFIVYHLLHLTARVTNPAYNNLTDSLGRFDVYSMVVLGFQNYLISAVYIAAMFLLGFHLKHAVASMFQTVGCNTPRTRQMLERLAFTVAAVIVIGNISIPITVLLGLVTLPTGGM